MRVVGYVREAADPREGEPAFAQAERIRRWATDGGHQLVAICQDTRAADDPGRREGLRAVMGILAGGSAGAVVVPELAVLSPDKIVQEILIRDLLDRGAVVISAKEDDHDELADPTPDRLRMIVRDVLTRVEQHRDRFALDPPWSESDDEEAIEGGNVVVEPISPEPPAPVERIRPVR